jgi:hypothetical protein
VIYFYDIVFVEPFFETGVMMSEEAEIEMDIARLSSQLEGINVVIRPEQTLYDLVPDLQQEWDELDQRVQAQRERDNVRARLVAFIAKLRARVEQLQEGDSAQ